MNAPHVGLPLKLMLSYVLVGVLLAAPPFLMLRRTLLSTLVDAETKRLTERARALRGSFQATADRELQPQAHRLGSLVGDRITIIDRAGRVVADSDLTDAQLATVENHSQRPEVRAAWDGGMGTSSRMSATVKRDLIYVALPLEDGEASHVLRLASAKTALTEPIDRVLVALRVSIGLSVSVALLLSLAGAALVSRPLRRMRDAAREFARSNWVEAPAIRTGDELQELAEALAELGRQIRLQLVSLGASESILVQVLERLDTPAAVVRADGSVVFLNGRFREALRLRPEGEETEVVALVKELRQHREQSPLAETFIWRHPPHGVPIHVWSLARPAQEPWSLLLTSAVEGDDSAADATSRQLRSLDSLVDALWSAAPSEEKVRLSQVRLSLDDLIRSMNPAPDGSVVAYPAQVLIGRSVEQAVADPVARERLVMTELPQVALAECGGLASLLVRQAVRGAMRTLRTGDRVKLTCEVEASRVRLRIQGGVPTLAWAAQVPRGLGAELELESGGPGGGMAEPSPRLSPAAGSELVRLEPHDHEQLEVQLGHAWEELAAAARRPDEPDALDLELYLFIPRNVGLNPANYSRTTFYGDLTSFVRADLPALELAALADAAERRSPLVPLASSLKELGKGAPAGSAVTVQIKLFGHAFAEAVRAEAEALIRALAEAASGPARLRWLLLDRVDRFGEQAQAALAIFRQLGRQLGALSYAAPHAQQAFRQTDEYSSLCLDATLAELSIAADTTPALFDGACFVPRLKLVLARHARPEAEYRRWVGFLNLGDTHGNPAEYFSYRQSLLKKAVHQALWVETQQLTRNQYLRNVSGMVAAGLAATWAAVAQLPLQWAKLSAGLQTAVVAVPVVAYIAKDRIKELTREWLMRRVATFDQSIALSTQGLGDAGTGEMHGTLRERMRFISLAQLPPEIMATRVAQRTVSGSELAGESCIHYLRKLEVMRTDGASRGVALRHILRLNLRHFFARMDEPEQRVRHFSPSHQAFIEARIPKVYHLNIIVRARRNSGLSAPTRWRVVLDKRGIVRVERTRVA